MKKWNDDPLFVFAKSIVDRDNLINEFKKIIAEEYILPVEMVTIDDCANVLLDVVYDIMVISGNPKQMFTEIFEDIRPSNTLVVGYDFMNKGRLYNIQTAVVYKCISIIRYTKVSSLESVLNKGE